MAGSPAVLLIDAADLAALRRLAAEAYPEECCGLLVGRGPDAVTGAWRVTRILPTINRAADRRRHFEVDPATHIALLRSLREQTAPGGDRLLGPYHSHPDAPAEPSEQDRLQAFDPDAIWLILGTAATGAGEVRAWRALVEDAVCTGFSPMTLKSPGPPQAS